MHVGAPNEDVDASFGSLVHGAWSGRRRTSRLGWRSHPLIGIASHSDSAMVRYGLRGGHARGNAAGGGPGQSVQNAVALEFLVLTIIGLTAILSQGECV